MEEQHIKRVHEVCETQGRSIGARSTSFSCKSQSACLMWQDTKGFFFLNPTPFQLLYVKFCNSFRKWDTSNNGQCFFFIFVIWHGCSLRTRSMIAHPNLTHFPLRKDKGKVDDGTLVNNAIIKGIKKC